MFPAESQERDHEVVEIAVEDRLDVPGLVPTAQVLDELVGSKHVGAYLASPSDLALRPDSDSSSLRRSAR